MSVTLTIDGQAVTLEALARSGDSLRFTFAGTDYHFRAERLPDGTCLLEQAAGDGLWTRQVGAVWNAPKAGRRIQLGALEATVSEQASHAADHTADAPLSPSAPMPGLVRQLLVAPGALVEKGQPLAVMEAMKLQITLSAGAAATVEAVLVRVGDMVAEGSELVRLKARP